MKFLLRIVVLAGLCLPWTPGCESTSGGGSQTNWARCKGSADCNRDEICRDERCVPGDPETDGDIGTSHSAVVRTSCVDRLGAYWGQCLAYESECQGDTATLRVVRTAICTGNGHALLSCTDLDGKSVQVVADVAAFGGELPALTTCACDQKTGVAVDADLKLDTDDASGDAVLGCRSDGVSVNGSLGWGGDFETQDGGSPEYPYGAPFRTSSTSACPRFYGTAMGGCVSFDTCFTGCTASADCPLPDSGNPAVDCSPLTGQASGLGSTCILHCDVNHHCPDGMACAHGTSMGDICLWPDRESKAGCP